MARHHAALPLAGIVYTDIARDGMLSGPNLPALAGMVGGVSLPVIASGGVANAADIRRVAEVGAAGCIVGRALYEKGPVGPNVLDDRLDEPPRTQAVHRVAKSTHAR